VRVSGGGGFSEEEKREPLFSIGEVLNRCKAEEMQLLLKFQRVKLSADLHQDLFLFFPYKRGSMRWKVNLLGLGGDGAHFHTLPLGVVYRVEAHLVKIKVALEKPVDVLKNVEDKFRGYSLRIVVRPLC